MGPVGTPWGETPEKSPVNSAAVGTVVGERRIGVVERVLPIRKKVEATLTAIEELWKNHGAADRSAEVMEVGRAE